MDLGKAVSELNAVYEAKLIEYVRRGGSIDECEIDLFEPFFGMEWGIEEWNTQRQKWRWLGPRGQSHLYLKLSSETDHLIRIYIHSASQQAVEALNVLVNGTICRYQGLDWSDEEGVPVKWCIVDRNLVEEQQGVVKVTWSLLPTAGGPQAELTAQPGQLPFARSIAFSRVACSPYQLAQSPCEIDLSGPFFGTDWGKAGWNAQRQRWRWLGPRGQSHLCLRLSSETDHLIRIYVHSATEQAIEALNVLVNGTICTYQGLDFTEEGMAVKWCVVDRNLIEEQQGVVEVTWSLLPGTGGPQAELTAQPGQSPFAESIAFSRLTCSPYLNQPAQCPCEIDLCEPFFGTEWGIGGWNIQRQRWRWLGPHGQSHLYLKLSSKTDYRIRIYVHTAPVPVLEALKVFVNGTLCRYQGLYWSAEGTPVKWCIVDGKLIKKQQGIVKVTWSLLPTAEGPQAELTAQPGQLPFARSMALSRVTCSPYLPYLPRWARWLAKRAEISPSLRGRLPGHR